MDIINCKEEQINWVDILYSRKRGFLSEPHIVFCPMFSGPGSIVVLAISQVDDMKHKKIMFYFLRCHVGIVYIKC